MNYNLWGCKMRKTTDKELSKIIEEYIGDLRAEFRKDLGNVYSNIENVDDRYCADMRSITDDNKDILKKIENITEWCKALNHDLRNLELKSMTITDMVNIHEKEIDKLQQLAEPIKTKMPKEYKWIGYLCKFKDRCNEDWQSYSILESVDYANTDGIFEDKIGTHWQECEIVKLTDPEVYKISKKDLDDIGSNPDFIDSLQRYVGENKINDKYKVI